MVFLNALLGPCMALLWRTRRYLADAGSVELTRNPDALARALARLSQDNTAIAGGAWASHLFVVNPKGDSSLRGLPQSDEQKRKAIEAWKATAIAGGATVTALQTASDDYLRMRKEMMITGMAAMRGDVAAMARMQAFAQAMGGEAGLDAHKIPNLNDLVLAQKGDRAASARLRALRQDHQQEARSGKGRTGLQTYSFLSFHPPLNKRTKRLQKMGAKLVAQGRRWGPVMTAVMVLVYAVGAVAFAFVGAMMLFVIAMMIGLNLLFLTLWLSVIHWAFAQDWAANAQGFIKFVNDVVNAFQRMR